ncbi:MAG: AMP-dependent synthetase and ligase, partial [Chloroflexi bacterium]|nr:AMP-dependent synthetase and ligase [Chloroflexota bacterium]
GYYLSDSHADAFICQPERLDAMQPLAKDLGVRYVHSLSTDGASGSFQVLLASSAPSPAPVALGLHDVAAILYTSGTTGRPKGAVLTQQNLISNIDALHEAWGWRDDDLLVHALPLFHTHGLFVAVNGVLRAGASMVFLPRFDPDAVIEWLPRASVFMGVPTMYHRLAQDHRLTPDLCRSMRLFVSGSAPLSVHDFEGFRARSGHAILERYGMTETTMNISNPLTGPRKPGTVGLPLPGVEVRLVDPESHVEVPSGSAGEIWLRGPNVFAGYFERPDATAEAFSDGWFRTGDLAQQDADGYYAIVGRCKDLIITGGLNVYPAEVEAVLDAIGGVDESAVIGLPDPDLGEQVTAIIVRSQASQPLTGDVVKASARNRLASYKCPTRVEFVESLPRNAMGKVEKARLRQQFSGPPAG